MKNGSSRKWGMLVKQLEQFTGFTEFAPILWIFMNPDTKANVLRPVLRCSQCSHLSHPRLTSTSLSGHIDTS